MADDEARDAPQEGAPTRLTRRALFDLRLEEMRLRGEPTEGMSQHAPTRSCSSEDSNERTARFLALVEAMGLPSHWSSEDARQEQFDKELARKYEEDRQRELKEFRGRSIYSVPSEEIRLRGSSATGPVRQHPSLYTSPVPSCRGSARYNSDQFVTLKSGEYYTNPRLSGKACDGSEWRHSVELRLLQEETLEAARFRPEDRPLFRTFDMSAVPAEPNNIDEDTPWSSEAASKSAVPASFPPHRTVDGVIELGTYLASSSYIVSLGGPPLLDLKYGIIIVPAGEEALLFSGYGEHAAMSAAVKEVVYTKSKAAQQQQEIELRQRAADELANEVGSEPELDEDDREFYRRRWQTRNGGVVQPAYSKPLATAVGTGCLDATSNDDVIQRTQRIAYEDVHEPQSVESSAHSQSIPAALTSGAGEVTPIRQQHKHNFQLEKAPERQSRTSTLLKGDEVGDVSPIHQQHKHSFQLDKAPERQSGASILSKGDEHVGRHACTKMDAHTNHLGEESMSPEAREILEPLLRKEIKRRGMHRTIKSLLSKIRPKHSPGLTIERRSVFLEVAELMTGLANGELCENPGIDRRLWEAAQKDLDFTAHPREKGLS